MYWAHGAPVGSVTVLSFSARVKDCTPEGGQFVRSWMKSLFYLAVIAAVVLLGLKILAVF